MHETNIMNKLLALVVAGAGLALVLCKQAVVTGTIDIRSDPAGAEVYLNDSLTADKTDCLLGDVPLGRNEIRLELAGYQSWKKVVELIEEDPDQMVYADLSQSSTGDPPDQVTGLAARATVNGAGVVLSWDPADNAQTYNVYFNGELLIMDIIVTEYTDAYPGGAGTYEVSGQAGSEEGDLSDPLSTEPIYPVTLTAWELNGAGWSGISWDIAGQTATTYTMATEDHQDRIDCYFTDYSLGFTGVYMLASPDELSFDDGNTWLSETGWRASGISDPLGTALEDVDTVQAVGYYLSSEAIKGETYAVSTQDDYYALIEILDIDTGDGSVDFRTTFQLIQGLRLF